MRCEEIAGGQRGHHHHGNSDDWRGQTMETAMSLYDILWTGSGVEAPWEADLRSGTRSYASRILRGATLQDKIRLCGYGISIWLWPSTQNMTSQPAGSRVFFLQPYSYPCRSHKCLKSTAKCGEREGFDGSHTVCTSVQYRSIPIPKPLYSTWKSAWLRN